jgi:hypothetical protein
MFIIVDVIRQSKNLEKNKNTIIYRFIPKTFEEEQMYPVYPSDIFETMFSQPSPWIMSIREYDRRKQENINQYFINQY